MVYLMEILKLLAGMILGRNDGIDDGSDTDLDEEIE
jgi:hypothetical protein